MIRLYMGLAHQSTELQLKNVLFVLLYLAVELRVFGVGYLSRWKGLVCHLCVCGTEFMTY